MTTIEERYGCTKCNLASCEGCDSFLLAKGATEQRAIDIDKFKEICEKWKKVYLHKATSPSPYSRQIAPEQCNAVDNVLVDVLKEFGVYPEEEEE